MLIEIGAGVVGVGGKVCSKCGEWKPRSEYFRCGGLHLRADCKRCSSVHTNGRHGYQREYRKKNAERRKSYNRQWRNEHPDLTRAQSFRDTGRRRSGVAAKVTVADIEAIRIAQGDRCYICHKKLKKYHVDHFIPLALGGTNDIGNLRLACPKCNISKNAKHPHDLGILI